MEPRTFIMVNESGFAMGDDDFIMLVVQDLSLEDDWYERVINFIALGELGEFVKIPNGRIIRMKYQEWKGM